MGKLMRVDVERLEHCHRLPTYQTEGSSGMDIYAADAHTLKPFHTALVATGFKLRIPQGYEGQIRPRSGIAMRRGITVLNSPGTIDADYRGEVQVLLINLSPNFQSIDIGDRIAQLVFAEVNRCEFMMAVLTEDTARGAGGFGSTGER